MVSRALVSEGNNIKRKKSLRRAESRRSSKKTDFRLPMFESDVNPPEEIRRKKENNSAAVKKRQVSDFSVF